jgi:hypothetical protein
MEMSKQEIETLLKNGIFRSYHVIDKMRLEKITLEQIKEALLNGVAKADNSSQNDKSFAHNNAQHYSIFYNGFTVVFCNSRENGIMLISVYHGESHKIHTNPYYRLRF